MTEHHAGFDPRADAAVERVLDSALRAALPPPPVPGGLRAAVWAQMHREEVADLALQRAELEADRARHLADLRRGYLQVRRDTLLMVAGVAFTAGAAAAAAAPWLHTTLQVEPSWLWPGLALTIGLAAGAGVWAQRLGGPAWWAAAARWRAATGL